MQEAKRRVVAVLALAGAHACRQARRQCDRLGGQRCRCDPADLAGRVSQRHRKSLIPNGMGR